MTDTTDNTAHPTAGLGPVDRLRRHWPEYAIEAWGLGTFMFLAGVVGVALESALSPVPGWIENPDLRRGLFGIAMGLTAIGIIYSPWGKRSGAHINPAITITFARLGKVHPGDAAFYILFQFIGGTTGILLAAVLFGAFFTDPPVMYVVTQPGVHGPWIAFATEIGLSFGLMMMILFVSARANLQDYVGLFAGIMVATYITSVAPLSGMSINPARTFASAAPSGVWTAWWIYFTAPIVGMLSAVEVYRLITGHYRARACKLYCCPHRRCIHCGYDPADGGEPPCRTMQFDRNG